MMSEMDDKNRIFYGPDEKFGLMVDDLLDEMEMVLCQTEIW